MPLGESGHILLVMATDAINSESEFGNGRRKLIKLGRLPVMLRTVRVEVRIIRQSSQQLRLFALGLNGKRKQELPVRVGKDWVAFTLDTADLRLGPTTYFELVTEAILLKTRKSKKG
jgi:hypothetical protein